MTITLYQTAGVVGVELKINSTTKVKSVKCISIFRMYFYIYISIFRITLNNCVARISPTSPAYRQHLQLYSISIHLPYTS